MTTRATPATPATAPPPPIGHPPRQVIDVGSTTIGTTTPSGTSTDATTRRMRAAVRHAEDRFAGLLCRAAPADATAADAHHAAHAALMAVGDLAVEAAVDAYSHGRRHDNATTAWLLLLLTYLPVRDLAWTRATTPTAAHLRLWRDVTTRAPWPLLPAPACLLACTAWRGGDPTAAALAVDIAVHADPTYSMGAILTHALQHAAPPAFLDDILTTAGAHRQGSARR